MSRVARRTRSVRGVAPWALLATASCNAVLGIEAYGPGPPGDGGDAEGAADAARDAARDGTDGAPDTSACMPGATQCVGASTETCGAGGQWGSPVPCAATTPFCSQGSCTSTQPSCAPGGAGMTNCGTVSESCCRSLAVAGGTYHRTYTNDGDGGTNESDPATVSGFRLDKYLVTVGRFRQFVAAWNGGAGYTPTPGSGKHTHLNGGAGVANGATAGAYEPGWIAGDDANIAPTSADLACDASYATWTATAGSQENLPVNCVNWYEAYAFCIWDGGFLPTEAEWEFAAADGAQQRQYPWGSAPPGNKSRYAIYGCDYPTSAGSCTGVASIAPVGSATLGAGAFGQLDMAGDLSEWTMDYNGAFIVPCVDCAELETGSGRVVRGGYYRLATTALLPTSRAYVAPAGRNPGVGLRCAKVP